MQTTENQMLRIERWIQLQSYSVAKVYEDKASGGSRDKRPALELMLAEVDNYDGVVCLRIDRLARSARDLLNIIDTVYKKKGKFIEFIDPPIKMVPGQRGLQAAMNEVVITVLGAIAQLERVLISERNSDSAARRKAAGIHVGAVAKKLDNDRIVELHRQGYSTRAIAEEIGVKSKDTIRKRLKELGEL